MEMTFHIYIGVDAIDRIAYQVLEQSILDNATVEVQLHPIRDWEVRQRLGYRRRFLVNRSGQKTDQLNQEHHSTEFTFTRFLTPIIHTQMKRFGPALFLDPDMMCRTCIGELFQLANATYDVQVVQHTHSPREESKIIGVVQQTYARKNWSSLMLFPNPARCALTVQDVNSRSRNWLHQFKWAHSVGSLPVPWNWLAGYNETPVGQSEPFNVHYTEGTPDLPGYEDSPFAKEFFAYAERAGFKGIYHNGL